MKVVFSRQEALEILAKHASETFQRTFTPSDVELQTGGSPGRPPSRERRGRRAKAADSRRKAANGRRRRKAADGRRRRKAADGRRRRKAANGRRRRRAAAAAMGAVTPRRRRGRPRKVRTRRGRPPKGAAEATT